MTGRVPVLLVIISRLGAREEGFLVDTGIPRLVEGGDTKLLVGILLDDPESVLVCVEGSHQDEGHIHPVGGV